ncbi:hypothetical protein [Pseudanabaena sp. PCC 6802]|uniref:hypothetical protein n=1 Tax=Pseudanabaena sp. PCC 6802 TaxID=118173 RepID=UPI0003451EFE|nr:hypothetical protein [Pseudanabaena sp. PCC 6802]
MSFPRGQLGLFMATCLSFLAAGLPVASQTALSPRFAPDPQILNGVTSGSTPLSSLAGSNSNGNCQGFAAVNPNHRIRLKAPFGFLSVKVFSDGGAVSLLVKGPDGSFCRDRSNPELSGAWAAGEYQIWVSSKDGDRHQYRLSISETRQ